MRVFSTRMSWSNVNKSCMKLEGLQVCTVLETNTQKMLCFAAIVMESSGFMNALIQQSAAPTKKKKKVPPPPSPKVKLKPSKS